MMEPLKAKALDILRGLGLSEYEALAYIDLLLKDSASPKSISRSTGIPYTKVYEVLKRLERKGWSECVSRRPVLYAAKRPSDIVGSLRRELLERLDRAEKILVELERLGSEKASLSSILVARSSDAINSIVLELYKRAERELRAVIATPRMASLLSRLEERRDLSIRILLKEGLEFPRIGEVRRAAVVLPIDIVIADSSCMLLSLGRLLETAKPRIYGVFLSDRELMHAVIEYFEWIWGTAKKD